MEKSRLFSYGTLSDPQFIQLLLQRVPTYEEAVLENYGLYKHPANGYLFIKPEAGKRVRGVVFELSWRELELIDYWEDVPLYEREMMQVQSLSGGKMDVFVYTQKSTLGIPATLDNAKGRQQILEDLDCFLEDMRRRGFYK